MSQEINEFLEALKDKTNSKLIEINNTVDLNISAIKSQIRQKINQIEEESISFKFSQAMIDSMQREIAKKQEEWLKLSNIEKGRLLDKLILKLGDQFKKITTETESYNLLHRMFQEIKEDAGTKYEVHISQNCDPDKFKTISGINNDVIADLDRVGVLIKRLDLPIAIENTLESRFAKNRDDLMIKASQILWGDLKESPWQKQKIMNHVLSKE